MKNIRALKQLSLVFYVLGSDLHLCILQLISYVDVVIHQYVAFLTVI